MEGNEAQVHGVYVGQPRLIGETRRGPVTSAIAKERVAASELELGPTNLEGDRQADLSVHGGPDKAVYAYPSDHYIDWQADGFDVTDGSLGENLALGGVTEHDVSIGDVWQWGSALVQVTQPRSPCYKLAVHAGRKDIGPRMVATKRTGWYLRVVEPGKVPTHGGMVLVERPDGAPTVHETFAAMFFGTPQDTENLSDTERRDIIARVLGAPALAEQWRTPLEARRNGGSS